jgi:small subunit ribosomal protein S13
LTHQAIVRLLSCGALAEWSNAVDCKSIGVTRRRFKSYRRHFKDPNKTLLSNLRSIYGISDYRGKEICMRVGVEPGTLVSSISKKKTDDIIQLLAYLNNLNSAEAIHTNLLRYTRNNIKRLKKINCLRGRRHRSNLPTRGQRTRSNGRSSKRRI